MQHGAGEKAPSPRRRKTDNTTTHKEGSGEPPTFGLVLHLSSLPGVVLLSLPLSVWLVVFSRSSLLGWWLDSICASNLIRFSVAEWEASPPKGWGREVVLTKRRGTRHHSSRERKDSTFHMEEEEASSVICCWLFQLPNNVSFGGGKDHHAKKRVVMISFSSLKLCCLPVPPLRGGAFAASSFRVMATFTYSSFGWWCFTPPPWGELLKTSITTQWHNLIEQHVKEGSRDTAPRNEGRERVPPPKRRRRGKKALKNTTTQ